MKAQIRTLIFLSYCILQAFFLLGNASCVPTPDLEAALLKLTDRVQQNEDELKALQAVQKELQENPAVPIGFLYVQLPNQSEPNVLWPEPKLKWADVTSSYAGLFFRAGGGSAEDFGRVQNDNTRQLVQWSVLDYQKTIVLPNPQSVPLTGWSPYGDVGGHVPGASHSVGIRFRNSDGEVRPRNAAIKIWKRVE